LVKRPSISCSTQSPSALSEAFSIGETAAQPPDEGEGANESERNCASANGPLAEGLRGRSRRKIVTMNLSETAPRESYTAAFRRLSDCAAPRVEEADDCRLDPGQLIEAHWKSAPAGHMIGIVCEIGRVRAGSGGRLEVQVCDVCDPGGERDGRPPRAEAGPNTGEFRINYRNTVI
jgi:hypothetical protein